MGLDIRIPLGLLFLIVGGLMTGYGAFTNGAAIYARSESVNLNLWWGMVMFAFGVVMFIAGRRVKWQDDPVRPKALGAWRFD